MRRIRLVFLVVAMMSLLVASGAPAMANHNDDDNDDNSRVIRCNNDDCNDDFRDNNFRNNFHNNKEVRNHRKTVKQKCRKGGFKKLGYNSKNQCIDALTNRHDS